MISRRQICAALCKLPLCQKSLKDQDGFTALKVPLIKEPNILALWKSFVSDDFLIPCPFEQVEKVAERSNKVWTSQGCPHETPINFGSPSETQQSTQIAQRWGFSAAADAIFRAWNQDRRRMAMTMKFENPCESTQPPRCPNNMHKHDVQAIIRTNISTNSCFL